jgi:hypothetical protein
MIMANSSTAARTIRQPQPLGPSCTRMTHHPLAAIDWRAASPPTRAAGLAGPDRAGRVKGGESGAERESLTRLGGGPAAGWPGPSAARPTPALRSGHAWSGWQSQWERVQRRLDDVRAVYTGRPGGTDAAIARAVAAVMAHDRAAALAGVTRDSIYI